QKQGMVGWLKKLGIAGCVFFLIKGLVSLVVLFGVGKSGIG
ncbi:MAG: alanyl-tRNA synthetase, partial [Bacteroidetes bacterium]